MSGDVLSAVARHQAGDVSYLESPQSPGVVIRMKSPYVRFFANLARYGAEPPSVLWVMTKAGAKAVPRGGSVPGSEMTASWILLSFQGSRGWEQFDAPWFLSLQRRPLRLSLSESGLLLEFSDKDSGQIYSMPLWGYEKLPQKSFQFAARYNLPSLGLAPWQWRTSLPAAIVERCAWWNRVAKAYPVGFDETFRVNPGTDEITFRQDFQWLTTKDDWSTSPLRFAALPPSVGLAWKLPGFPMRISAAVHDPDYFTAFGPLTGAIDVDRVEVSMRVLQYLHEFEWLLLPSQLTKIQRAGLERVQDGARTKFPIAGHYQPDHGGFENFAWGLAGDVWYPRALPFLSGTVKGNATSSLRTYFEQNVLRQHTPFHGKYLLHGPGIGSWGERGDAGKFMTTVLQSIWSYAQFTGDWQLIRDRWPLIRRFFVTPDEADWLSFGRYSIAEIGDEAAPCAAYARMAWMAGDMDEYLMGTYMFARELIHLYVKQRGGAYFYSHQPFQSLSPMPPRVYPTNVWGSTRGWQVDGPEFGTGEHQSANRWVRFQDPEVGRFYREVLAKDVRQELDWYAEAGRSGQPRIYGADRFREWLTRDQPHIMPSLFRLQSLLLDQMAPAEMPARTGWGAADIAVGYAQLRTETERTYWRTVPQSTPASPFVAGLQRSAEGSSPTMVQEIRNHGLRLEPRWHGWDMPRNPDGVPEGAHRSFGTIEGDFRGQVAGRQSQEWVSYGCRAGRSDAITSRTLPEAASAILTRQEQTDVAVIGPFGNQNDDEIRRAVYPPELNGDLKAMHRGLNGAVSWRRARFGAGRVVNLAPELANGINGAGLAYVQQYIWTPAAQDGHLLIGHQGGIAAWVNGERVVLHHGPHRPSGPDAIRAPASLRKGWNRVLLKVESFTGKYTVQFRFVHLDRLPIPNLRFSDGTDVLQ